MAIVSREQYAARFNVLAKLNRDLLAVQNQLAGIPTSTSNKLIAFGIAVSQLDLFIKAGGVLSDQAKALQLLATAESAKDSVLAALRGDVQSGVVSQATYDLLVSTSALAPQIARGVNPGSPSTWSLSSLVRPIIFW